MKKGVVFLVVHTFYIPNDISQLRISNEYRIHRSVDLRLIEHTLVIEAYSLCF
jgi:hypothetical protein